MIAPDRQESSPPPEDAPYGQFSVQAFSALERPLGLPERVPVVVFRDTAEEFKFWQKSYLDRSPLFYWRRGPQGPCLVGLNHGRYCASIEYTLLPPPPPPLDRAGQKQILKELLSNPDYRITQFSREGRLYLEELSRRPPEQKPGIIFLGYPDGHDAKSFQQLYGRPHQAIGNVSSPEEVVVSLTIAGQKREFHIQFHPSQAY